jgi:hypothetical protein
MSSWPYLTVMLAAIAATSALWRLPGLPIFGDWVPPDASYLGHIWSVWNPYEHNGTINPDLRALPWLALHALAAGRVGSTRFVVVSDLFETIAVALPLLTSLYAARHWLNCSRPIATLGSLVYGFNPWIASQVGAGHFGIVIGYSFLPVVLATSILSNGWVFIARGALLTAGALAFDVHMAMLSVGLLVIGRIPRINNPQKVLLELAGAAAVTTLLCAYWLVPTFVAIARVPYRPVSSAISPQTQAILAQMAEPLHLFTARSNWWPPFSDGLYTYGSMTALVIIGLLALPLALLAANLFDFSQPGNIRRWIGLSLLCAGTVPQLVAYREPFLYSQLARLPLGAFFRDVSDLTPLYILGLGLIAASTTRFRGAILSAAIATCVASLLPWATGDLRGNLRPAQVNDGQVAALDWLNSHSSPDQRTIWLPLELYSKFPWSLSTVNDPARFWSAQRIFNPIGDPAYDFSPQFTTALLNLETIMARQLPGDDLATMLAHAGVKYIVTRPYVESSDITKQVDRVIAHSAGIQLVGVAGGVRVYQVTGTVRADVQAVNKAALFDGSWKVLARASHVDPGLSRVYVPVDAAVTPSLIESSIDPSVVIGSSLWDALLRMQPLTVPGDAVGRERYPVDPGLSYGYGAGESISFQSRGIASIRVLAANGAAELTCNGSRGGDERLIFQQPDSVPRWYAIRCNGTAHALFHGHAFLEGFSTTSEDQFQAQLRLLGRTLDRIGSAYVLEGPNFAPDFIAVPDNGTVLAATWLENPLVLPSGSYEFSIRCTGKCPALTLKLIPLTNSLLGLKDQSLLFQDSKGAKELTIRMKSGQASPAETRAVAAGLYRATISGVSVNEIESLVVIRGSRQPVEIDGAKALPQSGSVTLGPSNLVAVNEGLGPWFLTVGDNRSARLFAADIVGSAYVSAGLKSTLSSEPLARLQALGTAIAALALAASVMLATARRPAILSRLSTQWSRKRRDL